MAFQVTYDVVSVSYVSADYAQCKTPYGSEVTIYWTSGKPDPLPRVNERWRVVQYMQGVWRFVSRIPSGKYKYMSYALLLDARDCIGKERVVVDDISNAGFDSVYIIVANYGEVIWNSECAEQFGLEVHGDNLSQLVRRFSDKSIPVTFVIGSRLWSDTSNPTHNKYQQVKVSGTTQSFSQVMSYASARDALMELIAELYTLYGNMTNGVCLYDVQFDSQAADFSYSMAQLYSLMYDKNLTYGLAEWDGTNIWWENREDFLATQEQSLINLRNGIYKAVGSWPVSIITTPYVAAIVDATRKVGELGSGISDDISKQGWTRIGFPITQMMSNDISSEMRSFEVQAAILNRLAKDSKPLPVLDIANISSIDGELEVLAKYGMGEVLVTDYKKWRLLTDDQMISLANSMSKYKVYEVRYDDFVGVVLSSMSRDVGCYNLDSIVSFQKGFESTCSEIVDKVPHRLAIMFDSDLQGSTDVSALVLYECTNMTDDAVSFVRNLSGVGVVFVGECGKYIGASRETRSTSPFADLFEQSMSELLNYDKELEFSSGVVDIAKTTYAMTDYSIGYKPIFGETGSETYVVGSSTPSHAPVVISGRSSMIGMSVSQESGLQALVGELTAYAVGRDS